MSTIRQYLRARPIDEMRVVVAPVLPGKGEALFSGIDLPQLGYQVSELVTSDGVVHPVIVKQTM